jgi:polyhydroxybutyrate depolymerase
MTLLRLLLLLALCWSASSHAVAQDYVRKEWDVDGVKREALVYLPPGAKTKPTPVIFAFHGHGGSMKGPVAWGYQKLWPEAMVVCPQGLPTPGRLTDPDGKKPGWQVTGGQEDDRDLQFFDTMLAALREEFRIDDERIYATGHSNGGGFTYLLWAERGSEFAAFAPSAGIAVKNAGKLKPKPVLHAAGEADNLVRFEWQKAMIQKVCALNQCGAGETIDEFTTRYPSKIGAPVVTLIGHGGHEFMAQAPAAIVKFFREQTLQEPR